MEEGSEKHSGPLAECQATELMYSLNVAFDLCANPLKSQTNTDFDQLNKKIELFRPTYEVTPTYGSGNCPLF